MLSPAANLPADILYHVFEIYRTSEQQPFPEVKLAQVCRHWRYAGLDFAGLWNKFSLSLKTPVSAISLYLQRSRDAPLTLDCDLRRGGDTAWVQRVSLVWELVIAAAVHWQHLSLKFDKPDAGTVIHDLTQAHTPMLQRLLLWTNVQCEADALLFGKGALHLEVLSLKGICFHQFISSAICTVKRLELSVNRPISSADFRNAVSGMPWLEHLSLCGNVVANWPIQLGDEVIILHSLRSLRLAEQSVPMITPLLSISAPLLLNMELVDLTSQDFPTASISPLLQQNYPTAKTIILAGILTDTDDIVFHRLFRMFPELDHLALIQVSEFLVQELNCALQQPSVWPQFQTFFSTSSPEGQTVLVSKTHPACEWEAAHLSDAIQLTRPEWLSGLPNNTRSAVRVDHELAASVLRYLSVGQTAGSSF